MQLRSRTPLRTLHATSSAAAVPLRPHVHARTQSGIAHPSSSPRSRIVNPLAAGVRRSRRVASLRSPQPSPPPTSRRANALATATDNIQHASSVRGVETMATSTTPPQSAVVTRARRKQTKVPSAVVSTIATRSARESKRCRVSIGTEERMGMHLCLLQTALSSEDDRLDETSWLTGTLMDLLLWRLASQYPNVHFLPTDFFHCVLESRSRHRQQQSQEQSSATRRLRAQSESDFAVRDVLGRLVDYASDRPMLFAVNSGLIHWNLFRVQLTPRPELQLFEPMGRLATRTGLSFRSVPRSVVEWLDVCFPQHASWLSNAVSAITTPQQVSGFDCGVACLLYADKCAQGQTREQIDARTDQRAITRFRKTLQQQLRTLQRNAGS